MMNKHVITYPTTDDYRNARTGGVFADIMKILLFAILLIGCSSRLDIDRHSGWLYGPDTWSLEGNGIKVYTYAGDCSDPEGALEEIRRRVEAGAIDWEQFRFTRADTLWILEKHGQYAIDNWRGLGNSRFANEYLRQICRELK